MFPSASFERTNKILSLLNLLGVVSLFLFSVLYLKSLCLLCAGYYVFSIASFLLFRGFGVDHDAPGWASKYFSPSLKHLTTFAVVTLLGAYGMILFHNARREAQSGGIAARVVKQSYGLAKVLSPSVISPFMSIKSTEKFEDAPIQVIEYADFLCPDCLYLAEQIGKLEEEFKGKINIAFQFFPLDAKCNQLVDKNRHPGACDISPWPLTIPPSSRRFTMKSSRTSRKPKTPLGEAPWPRSIKWKRLSMMPRQRISCNASSTPAPNSRKHLTSTRTESVQRPRRL